MSLLKYPRRLLSPVLNFTCLPFPTCTPLLPNLLRLLQRFNVESPVQRVEIRILGHFEQKLVLLQSLHTFFRRLGFELNF